MKFLDDMVPDKWIAAALPPKTRCRAVAWDEFHIVTQGEQVLADTGNQVLVVAPGGRRKQRKKTPCPQSLFVAQPFQGVHKSEG